MSAQYKKAREEPDRRLGDSDYLADVFLGRAFCADDETINGDGERSCWKWGAL